MSKSSVLTDEERELDPYKLLEVGPEATEKEIQRSYRKKSLLYHPDKNPSPEAAVTFHQMSLALGILTDQGKRTFVDTKLEKERAQRARYAEMSKKRQADVDDLVRREEDAKRAKNQLQETRKAAAEEEAIREAGRQLVEAAQKRARDAAAAARQPPPPPPSAGPSSTPRGDPQPPISSSDLTLRLQLPPLSPLEVPGKLEEVLKRRYGSVAHVIVREPEEGKKKKKGAMAIVEFATGNWGGCWACLRDHEDVGEGESAGEKKMGKKKIEPGVKARWANKVEPAWVAWAERQAASHGGTPSNGSAASVTNGTNGTNGSYTTSSFPLPSSAPAPGSGTTFTSAPDFGSSSLADLLEQHGHGQRQYREQEAEKKRQESEFESVTLLRMRQAERERMAEEIRKQEEAEEAMAS